MSLLGERFNFRVRPDLQYYLNSEPPFLSLWEEREIRRLDSGKIAALARGSASECVANRCHSTRSISRAKNFTPLQLT
jgi:hypothetical protein